MSVNFNPDEKKFLLAQGAGSTIEVAQTDAAQENYFSNDGLNSNKIDLSQFENSSEWTQIQAQQNSKFLFFGNNGYTFKTASGVEITIENPDDLGEAQIFENKETGEVFVINAKGAKIKSSDDNTSISIYNSQIDSINTKKGDDTINVYDSTITELNTGKGSDDVSIYNSLIESLETGAGSDIINIDETSIDKIKTNSGFLFGWFDNSSDTSNIENTDVNSLKTGKGNDTVIASSSNINTLNTKGGQDSVSLNNTQTKTNDLGKKDLKIENGNYLADFDISKIPSVETSEVITMQSGEQINVGDYLALIPQQQVGFETEAEYQQYAIQAISDNLESMKTIFQTQNDNDGIMADGFSELKELTGLGISSDDIENVISEQEEIINQLTLAMNGQSDLSFEEAYEKYTGAKFSTEKIDKYMELSNITSAINSGLYYDKDYADKFEEATGKSIDEINQEFALCQNEVLGKSQALQNLVDDYSASQEGFADKLSSIISTTGMVCIVAGAIVSFIPGGAAIGVPLMTAGKWVAFGGMLSDNAIDLIDCSTDKDGLTSDEVKNLALETGVELVSYGAGRAIGAGTNALNSFIAKEATKQGVGTVGSYVLGQTAETIADTTLSLGADYLIAQGQSIITTGEMMAWDDYWSIDRFLGEGRNQLMGILTGLSSSKVNAYSQSVIATAQGKIQAGDIEGAKSYLKQSGLGQYANGVKFNNLQASAKMPSIMPEVNAKIQAGDIEGAKQILSDNGLSNYTKGKNFTSIEQQAHISKAQEIITSGDIEGAKEYLSNNGLEKYSTGDKFNSIQAQANAPEILSNAQKMILEGNEKEARQYLKDQGLNDYATRDNFYQLTIQTKAPQIMLEVERLILEGDETGAKEYLANNGFKEYTNNEKFSAIVENIKTANAQANAVTTAKTMILEGDLDGARKLLEDSGLEVDNENFKALSDETLKSTDDTNETSDADTAGHTKIGLQFFAEKTTVSAEIEMTTEEKIEYFSSKGAGKYISEELAQLAGADFEKARKLVDAGVSGWDVSKFIKRCSDEEIDTIIMYADTYKKYSELGVGIFYPDKLKTLASFDETQTSKCQQLIDASRSADLGIEDSALVRLANVDEPEFSKILELIKVGVHSSSVEEYLKWDPEELSIELTKMTEAGIKRYDALKYAKKGDKNKLSRTIELQDPKYKKLNSWDKAEIVELDDTQYARFVEMFDAGMRVSDIDCCYKLTDEQYAEFKDMVINRQYDVLTAQELCLVDKTRYTEAKKIVGEGIFTEFAIRDICKLDDEQYLKFNTLIEKGLQYNDALKGVKSEANYYAANKLLEAGFNDYAISSILRDMLQPEQIDLILKLCSENKFEVSSAHEAVRNLDETQIAEAIKLKTENDFSDSDAVEIVKDLNAEQRNMAIEIKSKYRLHDYAIIKLAKELTSENFDTAKTLIEAGFTDADSIKTAITYEPDKLKIVTEAKKVGFEDETALRLTFASDDQIEVAMKLKEAGMKDQAVINLIGVLGVDLDFDNSYYKEMSVEDDLDSDYSYSSKKFDRYTTLAQAGFDKKISACYVKSGIEDDVVQNAINLKQNGLSDIVALELAKNNVSPEQLEIATILGKGGINNIIYYHQAFEAKMTADEAKLAVKYKDANFSIYEIKHFRKFLNDEQIEKINNFLNVPERGKNQFNAYDIALLAQLSDSELAEAQKLYNVPEKGDKQYTGKEIAVLAKLENRDEVIARLDSQKQKMYNNPERYVNGEYDDSSKAIKVIDKYFENTGAELLQLASVYDKEALDNLFRMRFEDVDEYVEVIQEFNFDDFDLLNRLSNSCNIDGKPFLPTQKIQFIDLIDGYKKYNLDFSKMETMLAEGRVDTAELNIDLFNQLMKNSGMTDEEIASIPKEKLTSWDIKYAHLLVKEINDNEDIVFSDLLRAANLEDFETYIHDKTNIYGQTNANTKAQYDEMGMNYDKWLHPSKENEVQFVSKDKNTERLTQIASQIQEDMNTLMQTPAKGFIRKQFSKFVKGDEFIIPNEYLTSKTKLTELVKMLSDTSDQGQMSGLWKRAQGNLTNADPNRVNIARNTLTVLDHLNQRIDDISKVQDSKVAKTLDLTIKMWDRNPQKDIFQGNYSTCCIGMGGGNGSAMPHFIMDTAYNMIELVDNTSGKTIGNALCYFAKNSNGEPIFIVDNIEISNSVKPSEEVGIELRDSITQYASNVAKEVTGQDDIPIYMSKQYNDVPFEDLPAKQETISFMGNIDCEQIYMDLYGGWIEKANLTDNCNLLKLK